MLTTLLHNLGSRRHQALVNINCAALPAGLIESELFGREKGAFTGVLTRRVGRFERAHEDHCTRVAGAESSPIG
jgi:formate hydrogenlyase transcriptional activator